MLAYLSAVLAAALLIKGKRWYSVVLGVVLLFFSLGIYQTYIVTAITICEMWAILEILGGKNIKWIMKRIFRFLIGGSIDGGLYLIFLSLLEWTGYLRMTETRGMDNILGNMFLNLFNSGRMAYKVSYDYFLLIIFYIIHGVGECILTGSFCLF